MASSSSSARNWAYDVFPSFSGEDIRVTFLSHFLKEFDRKLIIAFKDSEIKKSHSLWPELVQAIEDSRISIVLFSKNYASSSWCLNELLEIMKCKKEFGQMVIPVFYGLDPSHVRKQTGDFGKIFKETCLDKTKDVIAQWKEALTDVANILGYHSVTWGNEAKMIEEITSDVLDKLFVTPLKDSEDFVGIEDHIANMSELLQLESKEVRMVGLWGSSGIGKTTIARVLFNRLSRHFRGSIFIDRAFISKSMEIYSRSNPDDYSMKLHLQRNFLSELLGKKDVQVDCLGAVGERLKHQKVLIFIDDLDDHVVLDALVGQTHWFGCGSRVILVTNIKHLLTRHGIGIDRIYEVCLPSDELAIEILCRYAFKANSPPEGFERLVIEVARQAGSLPMGLNVLGSSLRGRRQEYWVDMIVRLQNDLDGKVVKTLRDSYAGLGSEENKVIYRHLACLFNGLGVTYMKLLLGDSGSGVSITLNSSLAGKSLINITWGHIEMNHLLQEMGRKFVRTPSSINEHEKREMRGDSKDIYVVINRNFSLWLEKTNGKRCIMLSARYLTITWGDNPKYWQWINTNPEDRFERVAKLIQVCWFNISCKIHTHALAPRTHYSACIVFKKMDTCQGFEDVGIEAKVGFVGKEASKRDICFDTSTARHRPFLRIGRRKSPSGNIVKPERREDGWMEIELGEFFNEGGLNSDFIEMSASETSSLLWKCGLIIQGIEIRPTKNRYNLC